MANEHYQAALQSHDCEELVQLIKTVYAKSRRHGRRVSQVDQRYRKRAEELLNSELSVALGIPLKGSSGVYQSEDWQAGKKRRQRKLQNKWKKRGFVASLFQSRQENEVFDSPFV